MSEKYMNTLTKWCFKRHSTKYCFYKVVLHISIKCSTDAAGCSDALLRLISVFLISNDFIPALFIGEYPDNV
jgi:hypothetical protein